MADKNLKSTSSKQTGRVPAPRAYRPAGGVQYANPYAVRYNAGMAGMPRTAPAPRKKQAPPPPVKKNRRRERDYFFIMRRGVCFLMMLLAIVWVAVIAFNYLGVMPQYTSFLVAPDLTPLDERLDVETGDKDEEGNAIIQEYVDQSVYISFMDPVFGVLKALAGVEMTDDEGNSMSPFYDSFSPAISGETAAEGEDGSETDTETGDDELVAEASEETTDEETDDTTDEEGAGTETPDEEGAGTETPAEEEDNSPAFGYVLANTDISADAREQDSMGQIASMAFDYAPIVLVLGALFAVVVIIIAFLALFGRRIFKGFGFLSIVMLLAGLAMFVAGMAAMGNYMGNPSIDEDGIVTSVLNFDQMVNFAFGVFQGAPATAPDPAVDTASLTMVAGYGLLIVMIIPVIILLLSIFARKKVPYSIFDK